MHDIARTENASIPPFLIEQMGGALPCPRVPDDASPRHGESARFIEPFRTGADAAIQEAQHCIVEALDLDGSTLFERSDDGDLLSTHAWWRPEAPAPPARLSARESFPWMLAKLLPGESICLSRANELPDGVDRASLLRLGLGRSS
jgi:hypothetical protein